MSEKLIINAAITGMVPQKSDNPNVPISPREIAADARRCADAGASVIHLHVRDPAGNPTPDQTIQQEVLARVHEACPDLVLCVSTSGRTYKSFEERSAVLEITNPKPEMASLTLGSMNFAKQASMNTPDMICALAVKMLECAIVPELEVFDLGMAEYSNYLVRQKILQPPFYTNVLLGNLGTLAATAFNLKAVIAVLPEKTTWAAAGIGRFQEAANLMGIRLGGHVRVGLEDNLWFDQERTMPASNPMLIERLVKIAKAEGRTPASPAEARRLIGLPPR